MARMDEIDAKLKFYFSGVVVRKDIVLYQEIRKLPRFISEYLIVSMGTDSLTEAGIKKIAEFVQTYYREPQERDKVLYDLVKIGSYTLIDEVKVVKDLDTGLSFAFLSNIGVHDAVIPDDLVEKNRGLLERALWGLATLQYNASSDLKVVVTDFKPFQIASVNFDTFCKNRKEFTTQEWVDVLISTLGYNPEALNFRRKLVVLSRLIPLVEENINLMELGPRNTGKTYTYRNTSYYTRIFSGGKISPAVLFWNLAKDWPGEIPTRDCVVFDEVSKIELISAEEMMGKLKDYMESAHYERGKRKGTSGCSTVFMGNVDVRGEIPIDDFTYALPQVMRDPAFIDRLHGFLPGWVVPKVGKADVYISKHLGFVTDYFSELLHILRGKVEFFYHVRNKIELSNVNFRDEKAILKLASGFLKLIAPHMSISKEDLQLSIDLAIEYRQRIADWLHLMAPGEFERKKIGYRIKI